MCRDKIAVVIPAAGQGKRMQQPKSKQYIEVFGKPILAMTLDIFENAGIVDEIILVVGEGEVEFVEKELIKKYRYRKIAAVVEGGHERQESVYKGIKALSDDVGIVMIHDAVRPLFDPLLIPEIIKCTNIHQACAVGVPVKDTIKIVNPKHFIVDTPDRSTLYAIQTPQAFKRYLIESAHLQAETVGFFGTDDTMLVEKFTHIQVKVIEGSYENIKVTTPEDLIYMEGIINRRKP